VQSGEKRVYSYPEFAIIQRPMIKSARIGPPEVSKPAKRRADRPRLCRVKSRELGGRVVKMVFFALRWTCGFGQWSGLYALKVRRVCFSQFQVLIILLSFLLTENSLQNIKRTIYNKFIAILYCFLWFWNRDPIFFPFDT